MNREPVVEALLENFYDGMRRGDAEAVNSLLSPELSVILGTDDSEWWSGYAAATAGFDAQFHAVGGLEVKDASPRAYRDGHVSWFEDRITVGLPNGASLHARVTGVARLEAGEWRIVQWHGSLGTPNADLGLDLPG